MWCLLSMQNFKKLKLQNFSNSPAVHGWERCEKLFQPDLSGLQGALAEAVSKPDKPGFGEKSPLLPAVNGWANRKTSDVFGEDFF
jgi:hypothetical protein